MRGSQISIQELSEFHMNPTSAIQELSLIIAAANLNPTLLTPEFLQQSGIVPDDWQLARQPELSRQTSQVAYTNGVSLVARPNAIVFSQKLPAPNGEEPTIPNLARKYVQILQNARYQALSINPRTFYTFPDEETTRRYIATHLLAPASWQNLGTAPLRAVLQLGFTLDDRPFNLSIAEVTLRAPEKPAKPALLFSGEFVCEIKDETASDRLQRLHQSIDRWQSDLDTYHQILQQHFFPEAADPITGEP